MTARKNYSCCVSSAHADWPALWVVFLFETHAARELGLEKAGDRRVPYFGFVGIDSVAGYGRPCAEGRLGNLCRGRAPVGVD
jgi:hypothetical protein